MRESERQYHTRLGWWVMTHERGGSALIGVVALAVLIADAAYAADRWTAAAGFRRGFAVGFAGLVIVGLCSWALRVGGPVGANRQAAQRRERWTHVLFLVLAGSVLIGGQLLGDVAAVLAGMVAVPAAAFVVMCGVAIARPSRG